MIRAKKVGSVCREEVGSLSRDLKGSLSRGQMGSVCAEFPGMGGPAYLDFPSRLSFAQARIMFDVAMNEKKNGIQVIYSCSPGESSKIGSDGSYFSNSLLQSIRDWALEYDHFNVMLGKGAYSYSTKYLNSSYGSAQTPMHYSGQTNLPFAIKSSAPRNTWANLL